MSRISLQCKDWSRQCVYGKCKTFIQTWCLLLSSSSYCTVFFVFVLFTLVCSCWDGLTIHLVCLKVWFLYLDFVLMIWCFGVRCVVPFHSVFCCTWLTWMTEPGMPLLFLSRGPNSPYLQGMLYTVPGFCLSFLSLTCAVTLLFSTVFFHLWHFVYWPAAFSSFLPFFFYLPFFS
jgi:hypothetical protein